MVGFSWLNPETDGSGASSPAVAERTVAGARAALRIGSERTTQDDDYTHLACLRGNPDDERLIGSAASLKQEEPPPPTWGDEARRWLDWYTRHVPTAEEFAQLLGRLTSEGLLTSIESASYVRRSPADSVAELTARVHAIDDIAHAQQQSDRS
ncbi:hypothetical protein OG225_10710 [Nocardia sp. NBC_01377]|uniref:hypothetical protein n=1 Tax=Nocardia sp. NBC_01377 TaxID=2903595 RepID=UPI003246B5A9